MTQPVLGILTLYMNEQRNLEERYIYQKMITAGKQIGVDVFVFTPQDVNEERHKISALTYNPATKRWSRKSVSFPHMIFDRCRLQKSYRFEQLRRFRAKYRHLPFLNRPLRNKWLIHQVLYELPHVQSYLPKTKLYSSIKDVQQMIKSFPLLYLKPINGTGGRGILRVEKLSNNSFSVYVQGRDHQRRIITPQKMNWTQLAAKLHSWNAKGRYIIQQGISIKLNNGRVHDYRMLVQKNGEGQWQLTGCAGRVGAAGSITSNLHGGGKAVMMDDLLLPWLDSEAKVQQIKEETSALGVSVASFLEEKYGALCELALDLAIDRKGAIYLLEVNPKPSREVFARIGDRDTYHIAVSRPIEYAYWYYHHVLHDQSRSIHFKSNETSHSAGSSFTYDFSSEEQEYETQHSQSPWNSHLITDEHNPPANTQRSPHKRRERSAGNKPYFPTYSADGSHSYRRTGRRGEEDTAALIKLIQSYSSDSHDR